jgi:hypothetical protein
VTVKMGMKGGCRFLSGDALGWGSREGSSPLARAVLP